MRVFYLIVLMVLLTTGTSMTNATEINIDRYFLRVEMRGVIAAISLNGAAVVSSEDTDLMITTEPVNIWLYNGSNTLSYKIISIEAENKTEAPMIKASLFLHDNKSEVPLAKKELAVLNYNNAQSDHTALQDKTIFEFSGALATRLWNDAEVLYKITPQDKTEIQDLISRLSSSVVTGDIEKSLALQKYKTADYALAEGHTYDALEKGVRSSFEWVATHKGVVASPYDKNRLKYSFSNGNRLVYITDENDKDILIFSTDELEFDILVFVAKINGKWVFAR